MTQDQMEQRMKGFKDVDQQTKPMGLIKGYGHQCSYRQHFRIDFCIHTPEEKTGIQISENQVIIRMDISVIVPLIE